MENRTLILNELVKIQESNLSLNEIFNKMTTKLEQDSISYYEAVNLLSEVTHKPIEEIVQYLSKDQYWFNMKAKADEKEEILNNSYESMKEIKVNNHNKMNDNIQEAYQSIIESKKSKEEKLQNLDNTLTEMFIK